MAVISRDGLIREQWKAQLSNAVDDVAGEGDTIEEAAWNLARDAAHVLVNDVRERGVEIVSITRAGKIEVEYARPVRADGSGGWHSWLSHNLPDVGPVVARGRDLSEALLGLADAIGETITALRQRGA